MTLVTLKEAAKLLGVCYETFRRKRAIGEFRRLKIVKYGDKARKMVVKESIDDQLKDYLVQS